MGLLDHLWQSSLVAILVYFLALLFRDNRAGVRYGLWFAASLKFLLPFSVLAWLGSAVMVQTVPAGSMAVLGRMRPVAMPFSAAVPEASHFPWASTGLALWVAGAVLIAAVWLLRWRKLSAAVRSARDLAFDLPIPVRSTALALEPGLVGIWWPAILLPDGIANCLCRDELDAIVRHELCHWQRRDNLLALVHMLVECIFWFHPLVWFIGARLVEERERACDEDVVAGGFHPLAYAQTILKVCRLYLRSPLACAAGVSGADLDRRVTAIMKRTEPLEVYPGKIVLLAGLALITVTGPLIMGGLRTAPVVQLTRSLAAAFVPLAPRQTEVATPMPRPRPVRITSPRRQPGPSPDMPAEVRAATLTAPVITASAPLAIIPVPELDTEQRSDVPEKTVCRPPQQLARSRFIGPEVCLTQQMWDRIAEQNLVLMPDGRTLVASFEKKNALQARICLPVTGTRITVNAPMINC
jgi:beta-lactamase regulating signal transducer with metallopeptidase domain